jgi:hypothetical protein
LLSLTLVGGWWNNAAEASGGLTPARSQCRSPWAQPAARVIAVALTERERWRTAGLDNAARFSTKAMISGYISCYQYYEALQLLCLYVNKRAVEKPTGSGHGS